MRLTRRLRSPPSSDEQHGLYCRIKEKLKLKPKTRRKLRTWGERVEAWWFKVKEPRENEYSARLAKMPENYAKYQPKYNAHVQRKNAKIDREEAIARAQYDAKEDDRLQELETKRFNLDKKIDRQANKMRWERQTRPPIPFRETPPPTPCEHNPIISFDGTADEDDADEEMPEPAPTFKDDVKKVLRIKSRETREERELRHWRERERTTADSEAARRTLYDHGISVRDFQVEYDEKNSRSLTDMEARAIEERRQHILDAYIRDTQRLERAGCGRRESRRGSK